MFSTGERRSQSTIIRYSAGVALLLTTATTAVSQKPAPTPEFVLAGFKDSRERLRTGEFRCTGTVIDDDPTFGRLEGAVEIYGAFDFDAAKYRFDRTEDERQPKPGQKYFRGRDDWQVGKIGGKFVKTTERSIVWLNGEEAVVIRAAEPASRPPRQVRPFDIRLVGIIGSVDIDQFLRMPEALGYLQKQFAATATVKVTRPSADYVRVELSDAAPAIEQIDFDEKIGYLPVRQEQHEPKYGVTSRAITEWERVAGVGVPKKWQLTTGAKPGRVRSFDLNFTWVKVNEPIAPETFMTRGMGAPEGADIVSVEMGKNLSLGKIGDLEPHPDLLEIEPPAPKSVWWYWAGGIIGTIALLLSGYFAVRHSRRGRAV